MKNVRELGKRKHNHLERHDHREHTQKIYRFCRHVLYTDDVPCSHGTQKHDQCNRNHGNKYRVSEAAEEIRLLDCRCIVGESYKGLVDSRTPSVKAL